MTIQNIRHLTLKSMQAWDIASGRSPLLQASKCDRATAPQQGEIDDMSFGDAQSARRLTQVIATIHSQSAHVVGITGARQGVGVSITSRQLAGALANFGTKTLLLDAGRAQISEYPESASSEILASAIDLAREMRPSLAFAELGEVRLTSAQLREAIAAANQGGHTVVVDLPPVSLASGQPSPSFLTAGRLCDLVFLVCLSGEMQRRELTDCIETCGIVDIKLAGLILNDWKLPGSRWLD